MPKAVIWSLAFAGVWFVFMSYVEVFGASHAHLDLASLAAPLTVLSKAYGVAWFKVQRSQWTVASSAWALG